MKFPALITLGTTLFLALTHAALAQTVVRNLAIVQSRGVDSRVDYQALSRIGPWDDRNYQLTLEDVALLASNEAELTEAIPAFYRVQLRRAMPGMPSSGAAQYPHSVVPWYLNRYRGFLIDGRLHTEIRREAQGYVFGSARSFEPAPPARGSSLVAEARMTQPVGAAESAIAIHPIDTQQVIAGSHGPKGGQRMHYSTDGGLTWTQAADLIGVTCCDPTVAWSVDGSFAYTASLGTPSAFPPFSVYFYRSADGGRTWDDLKNEPGGQARRVLSDGGGADKEYLHVDSFPTSPFRDRVYLTWHEHFAMKFGVSDDLGHSWTITSLTQGESERGIGGDLTTDRNGILYYLWPAIDQRQILFRRSTDGGASFAPTAQVSSTRASLKIPIPAMETRTVLVYVSADADRSDGPFADSIYVAWTDSTGVPSASNPELNHTRIQVASSHDGGASFDVVTPHQTDDSQEVDRFHPWLRVGPDGRVHVVFYDTRHDATRSSVDLYHAVSSDGGQSFAPAQRLTSVSSPELSDSFELGDYNGLDVVVDRLIASFTDNRDELETGRSSKDIYVAARTLALFVDGFETGGTSAWSGEVHGSELGR